MEFNFHFGAPRTDDAAPRDADAPMRVVILGDFSARKHRGLLPTGRPLADRSPLAVDVDNFEQRLAGISPELRLSLDASAGADVTWQIGRMEDFHPDELYRRLAVFRNLRDLRDRLLDPATFAAAAAELRRDAAVASPAANQPAATPVTGTQESDAATLERILGESVSNQPGSPSARFEDPLARWVRSIVTPHLVPGVDPTQPVYLAHVEDAISVTMRRLLHHPAFQALESLWRGTRWLVSRLGANEAIRLYLLDVSQAELTADLAAAGTELHASGLYASLVDREVRVAGGQRWTLLIGDYTFGSSGDEMQTLAALGALASQAGGPFLAAAASELLGCRSWTEQPDPRDWQALDADAQQRWELLRRSAGAASLGLALPRVLLRNPYGKQTDAVESFGFEEIVDPHEHEAFLWGNPAFACAWLLGAAFEDQGWSLQPGDQLEVDDLPAYTYPEDGERRLLPCAEVCLTERTAETILGRGLMPLMSYKNRNAARLMRFQSLAFPPAPLRGAWSAVR